MRLSLLGVLCVGLLACRGEDLAYDCDFQRQRFEAAVDGEGELRDAVPEDPPFPVALAISEAGIDQLLEFTLDTDVPFAGDVPFGPVTLQFTPKSDPVVELLDYPGCVDCIVIALEFDVELQDQDGAVSSGTGSVRMDVPLTLDPVADGATSEPKVAIMAHYEDVRIEELVVSVYGFDSEDHEALAGALTTLMEENIRELYGPRSLLELGSWAVGDGSIRLEAKELFVFPAEKSLALGMQTNLLLPEDAGLDKPTLPAEIPMQVKFHGALFEAIAQRMLTEGTIPRRYDEEGAADPDGIYGVTIESLRGSESMPGQFDCVFRVWRIDGGYCGYAEAFMGMPVELVGETIRVTAGEPIVRDGQGSGAVAAEEDELVAHNAHVVDEFKNSLAEQLELAIDWRAVDIEGQSVVFDTLGLQLTPDALTVDLDFFVVVDP